MTAKILRWAWKWLYDDRLRWAEEEKKWASDHDLHVDNVMV